MPARWEERALGRDPLSPRERRGPGDRGVAQVIALRAYQLGMLVLVPALLAAGLPIVLAKRKRRGTVLPRLGWQRYPRAPNHARGPVWVHALSVGELLSAARLIRETKRAIGDRPLYVSVSTLSAFELVHAELAGDVDGIFYFPYDVAFAVNGALRAIRPSVFVLVETDIWPGFLATLRARRIPSMLVNARLSTRTHRNYARWRVLIQPSFAAFKWVYPQSPREARRFIEVGLAPRAIRRCGNLKFDVCDPMPTAARIAPLRASLAFSPATAVLLAGSTHPGEESQLRDAYLRLRARHANLVLVLVPRHPDRAQEVRSVFRHDGLDIALYSELPRAAASVLIVDRIGLLSRLYAIADVAFVGGSLVERGGHNPIEPAVHGKPVLFGPDMSDFLEVSHWLTEAGGAIQVADSNELARACAALLGDPARARSMGRIAREVVQEHSGMTAAVVRDIVELTEEVGS